MSLSPLSAPADRRRRRWPARVLVVTVLVLAVLVVVAGVGGWIGSSLLLDPHHDLVREDVAVRGVAPGRVTLAATKASRRPGVYGLDFKAGHAIAGSILTQGGGTVTRQLRDVHGRLASGTKVAIDPAVYTGDPRQALGVRFRSVSYADPLGPMPAWVVPGRSNTWVVFVHGIDGTRQGGLRVMPTLRRAGLPVMLVDYRNDKGAPESPDGLIHLGMTEWQDLDAAVHWARVRGARRFVLYGDSMGGSIVTRFMRVSPQANLVRALVLDAPALDWESILDGQASRYDVPFMGPPIGRMIGERIDFDWGAMNEVAHAADFAVPILLFQGLADPLVPPKDSAAFAHRARPGLVTYVTTPQAGHIQSWNVDPARYEAALARFLARNARP
jgi:pimeloyl-ACP methyl ester carboxylesterase